MDTVSADHFEKEFLRIQKQLTSYLLRMLGNRQDAEDLAQDCYLKASKNISGFKGNASLKTWIFSIATNLARDHFRGKARWIVDAQHIASRDALQRPELIDKLKSVNDNSRSGSFEIKDHIDFCFTCMAKTLTIEQQVALILKEIYEFKVTEIMMIMNLSEGKVKHAISDARQTMIGIFEKKCSLINKQGACYQCSELNGIVNPKQNTQMEILRLKMVEAAGKGASKSELFDLRLKLLKGIDPLNTEGNELYAYFLQLMPRYSGHSH